MNSKVKKENETDKLENANLVDKQPDETLILSTENYYTRYEAFVIQAVGVQYKGSKAVLISFNSITDLKAKNRLLSLHLKMVDHFMMNNQRRMENLHKNLSANIGSEESND